jgi:hypothetical protein
MKHNRYATCSTVGMHHFASCQSQDARSTRSFPRWTVLAVVTAASISCAFAGNGDIINYGPPERASKPTQTEPMTYEELMKLADSKVSAARQTYRNQRLAISSSSQPPDVIKARLQEVNAQEAALEARYKQWLQAISQEMQEREGAALYNAAQLQAAAQRQAESAAESERLAALQNQPRQRPAYPAERTTSLADAQMAEFEKRRHVEAAVEEARRNERANAQARESGGGITTYSTGFYSTGVNDADLRRRIDTATEDARREELNNARARGPGSVTTHTSNGSFDPGPRP